MDDTNTQSDGFYADDVQAAALADNQMDDDLLKIDDDVPVTSGEMEIGNLDSDADHGVGSAESFDEETVAGGDNVVDDEVETEE